MLRCADCGASVSPWAAACPGCGAPTDNAADLDTPAVPAGLDPVIESYVGAVSPTDPGAAVPVPGRSRRRRWYVVLAAVVVYAGVVIGVKVHDHPTRATNPDVVPPALAGGPGQLLVMTSDGRIEATDPGGLHPQAVPNLGTFEAPAAVSADERLMAVGSDGQLEAVLTEQPGLTPIDRSWASVMGGPVAEPFADRDRALAISGPGDTEENNGISLLVLAAATIVPLGDGDDAAGDPQTLGAFVSVEAPDQPRIQPPGGFAGLVDSRLELRQSGRAPVVVATVGTIQGDLHQKPAAVHLAAYPDPAGDKLAVVVDPIGVGDDNAAMVVLDRHGRLLGAVDTAVGPTEYLPPAWSPDGRALAYTTFGPHGAALGVWTVGHSPDIRATPLPGDDFGGCLWAPGGNEIVCANVIGVGQANEWILAAGSGGPVYLAYAPGVPIAWLPTPPGA